MKNKIIAMVLIMSSVFLAGCENKPVKKKAVPPPVCHSENYVKAGKAAKAAGGTFYTCGGKDCIVDTKVKIGKRWVNIKYSKKSPGEFTISKGTKWTAANCGTIYKKRAK